MIRVAHVLDTLGLGGVPMVAEGLLGHLGGDRYARLVYTLRTPADHSEERRELATRLRDRRGYRPAPRSVLGVCLAGGAGVAAEALA